MRAGLPYMSNQNMMEIAYQYFITIKRHKSSGHNVKLFYSAEFYIHTHTHILIANNSGSYQQFVAFATVPTVHR